MHPFKIAALVAAFPKGVPRGNQVPGGFDHFDWLVRFGRLWMQWHHRHGAPRGIALASNGHERQRHRAARQSDETADGRAIA